RAEKGDAHDTRAIISRLAVLRADKAKLLGYPNYSAYVLYAEMAQTPAAVEKFIGQLVPPTRAKAAEEAQATQDAIKKDGQNFALKPWDWQRYVEKVRKSRYDLDEAQLKPYFELKGAEGWRVLCRHQALRHHLQAAQRHPRLSA